MTHRLRICVALGAVFQIAAFAQTTSAPFGADNAARLRAFAMKTGTTATFDPAVAKALGIDPGTQARRVLSTHDGDRSAFLVVVKNGAPSDDIVVALQVKPGAPDETSSFYLTDSTGRLRSAVGVSGAGKAATPIDNARAIRGLQTELDLWAQIAKIVPSR